ncbi:NAD(P)-binding protein [Microvirga sp. 3-52]|uniref:FAD-dependent oxidoreductase n=1 Tax=Microvirga sp. 3-52 TaxID=2792425 RepID=UPI001ACFC1C2|nr:FAD-dependent oxidoreductase [Microvirga sp. 3-52]MBO1908877.1 NAD(P)-binding protein [Microvirga sp. 3-52]MBS7455211.1 NAD(P)-binding protein [Microvirga sp. 3-52]
MPQEKLAVLGGGAGALSAVFAITSQPGWQQRFDITVYQVGWRLGGKCASGRNDAKAHRNEEHGFHIFGGFYHNTFRLMRDCYAEWQTLSPHAFPLSQAFVKHSTFDLHEQLNGASRLVRIDFPVDNQEPGINPLPLSPLAIAVRLMGWVSARTAVEILPSLTAEQRAAFIALLNQGQALLVQLDIVQNFAIAAQFLINSLKTLLNQLLLLLKAAQAFHTPAGNEPDYIVLAALAIVIVKGIILDGVHLNGFDAINALDANAWLAKHGAWPELVSSVYIQSGYDYGFAYLDGDTSRPSFAAGVALRGLLRMIFTYHGSVFYHAKGGFGEIVFTPLYEVLRERGVRFKFFHRVESLTYDPAANVISDITGSLQAVVTAGADAYDPFIDWKGRKVWPTHPKFELLADGSNLKNAGDFESWWKPPQAHASFTLQRGVDFDQIILGISVGALKEICSDLTTHFPSWQTMLTNMKTIPTIGVQVWSKKTSVQLGSGSTLGLATALEQPLSTWADMSFLVAQEDTRPNGTIQHLGYMCGPFPRVDPDTLGNPQQIPSVQEQNARATADLWMKTVFKFLLPGSAPGGVFDPSTFGETYVRANVNPSDEYVLSPPTPANVRFTADQSGIDNLFLAGDWLRTGVDVGAFESAVMSGLQCARAITGTAIDIYGEDDWV